MKEEIRSLEKTQTEKAENEKFKKPTKISR